ncbi:MAG TPA: DUF2892 domain-containing protein [Elusimicrobiota bacterium]|nr:DUF2892 domain-containing protein [Elusimicrobiota bacterium]
MTTMHAHLHHGPGHREPFPWQLHENRNVGGWERAARLFLGAAIFAIAFTAGPVWGRVILALLGTYGMFTSIAAYCPLNRAAGRDSYHHGLLR